MPGGIHPPLEVILSWPARSDHPIRRGWGITIATIVLWAITILVVAGRLWARLKIQKIGGLDDLIIVIALIPLTGVAICVAGSGRAYFDRHVWELTAEEGATSRKLVVAVDLLYMTSTTLTKISILLFYRRLASGTISNFFRWAVRLCIGFVASYYIAFTLALFLGCRPLDAFWNQLELDWRLTHKEGRDWTCFNESADLLTATSVSVLQDFITCLMPCILFWRLQLPFRQKVALAAVFAFGFFTSLTAVVRLYYIQMIFYQTYDVTWYTGLAFLWTTIEVHLGIICASAPALKIFFQRYFDTSRLTGAISTWSSKSRSRKGTMQPDWDIKNQSFLLSDVKAPFSRSVSTIHDIEARVL
ncbi:hypothetical protein BT63DRAFT_415909 [Microthyrium microscopicum]|uniref:Rhodopsin domain-containing protein n=1 Tax=Microthyrium microscopicum TaxID=703497 RepID=A0A6A6U3F3_9PEZI|nr:hypothetical protein BT63DRAFT_415909 [Microthyrium microscopicum]